MGDKRPVGDGKMHVARISDPVFLGQHAKRMAKELLTAEHRGPGDTIEAAAGRLGNQYRIDPNILLQAWNRPPREMKVSRWMSLFAAHYAALKSGQAYADKRQEAADEGVHPILLGLADLVSGNMAEEAPPVERE